MTTDARLTDADRARVVRLLRQTRDDFLAVVEPLTDAQWDYRPGPDRWSIGLIAEHLGIVERRLFQQIERALGGPANPEWSTATAGKNDLVKTMLADRGNRRDAPDASVPTGGVERAASLRLFLERRARSIAFAETTTDPIKRHTVDHHRPVYGTLNAYQWLLYIPLHHQRHLDQIDEIMAAPGYPA